MGVIIKIISSRAIPVALVLVFFFLALGGSFNESATADEPAHIAASYAYGKYHSLKLNPENPPLFKLIAGAPLQFIKVNFPVESQEYTDGNQMLLGKKFLFQSENNADFIVFLARMPFILIATIFAWLFYLIVKKIFNQKIAVLSLFLYALSPVIIGHAPLVNADILLMIGVFFGIYLLSAYIKKPTNKNSILLGVALGLIITIKFSVVSFFIYCLFVLLFLLSNYLQFKKTSNGQYELIDSKNLISGFSKIILIFELAALVVGAIYLAAGYREMPPAINIISNIYNKYLDGYKMAAGQIKAGHSSPQFLYGLTSITGFWYYFPLAYFIKTPLAMILMLISGMSYLFIKTLKRIKFKSISHYFKKVTASSDDLELKNIFAFNALVYSAIFLFIISKDRIDIGIRLMLPVWPFIFIFIGWSLNKFITTIKSRLAIMFIAVLFLWYGASTVITYPNYMSYFNELAGYGKYGEKFLNDSNLDWGQDLKYLALWVKQNRIGEINVDYFGYSDPRYYLADSYVPWSSENGLPDKGYLAVSKFYIMTSAYFKKTGQASSSYEILENIKPYKRIGNSILIYKLD